MDQISMELSFMKTESSQSKSTQLFSDHDNSQMHDSAISLSWENPEDIESSYLKTKNDFL